MQIYLMSGISDFDRISMMVTMFFWGHHILAHSAIDVAIISQLNSIIRKQSFTMFITKVVGIGLSYFHPVFFLDDTSLFLFILIPFLVLSL